MTEDEFNEALAADLRETFARNPEVSQRTVSEATGFGETSLNKYIKADPTGRPNMPFGRYLMLIDAMDRYEMIRRNHPALALLMEARRKPGWYGTLTTGRHDMMLYATLHLMTNTGNQIATNLLRYYERRVS
jgi:hypothetical protein